MLTSSRGCSRAAAAASTRAAPFVDANVAGDGCSRIARARAVGVQAARRPTARVADHDGF